MTTSPAPPESNVDHASLRRKAVSGAVTLVARAVVLQVLVFAGNLVLARILDPRDFGVFSISQFALLFFMYFGDAGLAGRLVQQHDKPSVRLLSSVLWLQLVVSAAVIATVWVASPLSHRIWTDLPDGSEWLLRALSFELLLTAARTVPSLLMERELQFGRLSALEVSNQLVFYFAAIPLALLGHHVWALVAGVLVRATCGVMLAYALRPFRPVRAFDWDALRPIVRFGIPYQMKNLVGFVINALVPVYAGHVLGVRAVGLLGWSRNLANTPIKLVDAMGRVGFPLYSRLQGNPRALGNALGRSVQVCAAGTFVFIAVVLGLGPQIIHIAYPKWTDALVLLDIFAAALSVGFLSPLVAAAFDAIGKPKVFLKLGILWTAVGCIAVPFTTARWGIVGFALGFVSQMVVGNFIVLWLAEATFPTVRILRRCWSSALAATVEGLTAHFVFAPLVTGWFTLVVAVVASAVTFLALLALVDRGTLLEVVGLIRRGGAKAPA